MSEPSRRGVFRSLAAAGAGALVCAAVPAPAAPVPKAKDPPKLPNGFTLQAEWRWCSKCGGLFYNGNETKGTCTDGKEHDGGGVSGNYVLRVGSEAGEKNVQGGWRRCKKCEGLFYGAATQPTVCPAGQAHDADTAEYLLGHTVE
jgi:hypothetical protein